MPGKRWGSPTGSPTQATRHFDAVGAAWRAASLFHSERITLILKRATAARWSGLQQSIERRMRALARTSATLAGAGQASQDGGG
jgi:hypothetical protein